VILFKNDHDDSERPTKRLRKTRYRSWGRGVEENTLGDLPTFLANSVDPEFFASADTLSKRPKTKPNTARKLHAWLHAEQLAAKAHLEKLSQRMRLPVLERVTWKFQNDVVRVALFLIVVPLVLLFMSDRSLRLDKNTLATPASNPAPQFNRDDRLAFAEKLREQFVSRGISSSLENGTDEQTNRDTNAVASEQSNTAQTAQENTDLNTPTLPTVPLPSSTDDRRWRLPFESKSYFPEALPSTAEQSFRAELSMSDIMDQRTTVAVNDSAEDTPAPVAKRVTAKRKKAVAQKKRPQPAAQMTASATTAPAVASQTPNLPPPPILFFLGAPPPSQSQP
jgi:hypothetical protein